MGPYIFVSPIRYQHLSWKASYGLDSGRTNMIMIRTTALCKLGLR